MTGFIFGVMTTLVALYLPRLLIKSILALGRNLDAKKEALPKEGTPFVFKSPVAAFEYSCAFMDNTLRHRGMVVAIVDFGIPRDRKIFEIDFVILKVAKQGGCFPAIGILHRKQSPPKPGQMVGCSVESSSHPDIPDSYRELMPKVATKLGVAHIPEWLFFVEYDLAPELNIEKGWKNVGRFS